MANPLDLNRPLLKPYFLQKPGLTTHLHQMMKSPFARTELPSKGQKLPCIYFLFVAEVRKESGSDQEFYAMSLPLTGRQPSLDASLLSLSTLYVSTLSDASHDRLFYVP